MEAHPKATPAIYAVWKRELIRAGKTPQSLEAELRAAGEIARADALKATIDYFENQGRPQVQL